MSYLTRRERDAVLLTVTSFGIAFVSGMLWGLGLTMFSAVSLVTFVVYAPAGIYLTYRGVRRASRWSLARYRGTDA